MLRGSVRGCCPRGSAASGAVCWREAEHARAAGAASERLLLNADGPPSGDRAGVGDAAARIIGAAGGSVGVRHVAREK